MWRYNSGTPTFLATYNSVATTLWQKLEFEVDGSDINIKTWVSGEAEPAFQVTHTDGSPLGTDGRFQLVNYSVTGGRWLRLDNVSLGTP